jgi:(p)ppGpp synthase/HD superfamily hydrolase
LHLASGLHRSQARKGTSLPYISHLLGVASLVLEDGGSEDEAIAALLHDAVEDQGGQATLLLIQERFGPDVAGIVEACSDTDVVPKPPWRERKEAYIAHLATAPPEVIRVSLADKLHNARAIVRDLRVHGPSLWERFHPDADQVWYYDALARAFREAGCTSPMLDELDDAVAEMKRLSG